VHAELGPHGGLVARFLAEVRTRRVEWAELAVRADGPGVTPAMHAITELPWPRAVLSAVDGAGLDAFASLGLSRSDFTDPMALGDVRVSVLAAAKAIAAGDQLAVEHRRVLLQAFADEGFESAVAALRESPESS
jgi:hypothetical protein